MCSFKIQIALNLHRPKGDGQREYLGKFIIKTNMNTELYSGFDNVTPQRKVQVLLAGVVVTELQINMIYHISLHIKSLPAGGRLLA